MDDGEDDTDDQIFDVSSLTDGIKSIQEEIKSLKSEGDNGSVSVDSLTEKLDQLIQTVDSVNQKPNDYEHLTKRLNDAIGTRDAIKEKLKEIEASREEEKKQWNKEKLDWSIKQELTQAGIPQGKRLEFAMNQIDYESIKVEDGKLDGLSTQLETMKESEEYSFLFNTDNDKSKAPKLRAGGKPELSIVDDSGKFNEMAIAEQSALAIRNLLNTGGQ